MFNGTHVLLYSSEPAADRAFLRDVLGFPAVDTGEGWLIMKLPPAEAGVHPQAGPRAPQENPAGMAIAHVYLMCADIQATLEQLRGRDVDCPVPHNEGWGITTTLALPSGALLGLYQPLHETALGL